MFNLLWNKPKPERFSLDNLKILCTQLKSIKPDSNDESIISCLKELTQLLIWGDQHDRQLLEHFFEEGVHTCFLEILNSKHDGSIVVQVLQTLNIMFENVRSSESLYYLLSNNYVNNVINLKYDFSNEETLAYYIYLLRTLSFKLSKDTVYFFFNEQLDDFPLYSEAIKFFNHEESMIRIAVRVITLNVYSVNDSQMQDFILDRTTTTYFSNLVWFVGNYGTTINDMLLHPSEGDFSRINYYLAEHMDCFYYVNDIIELEVPKINKILISNLLNRLLRPMYLDSLLPVHLQTSTSKSSSSSSAAPKLTPLVALSLMLHAFHVLKNAPLVSALASTLFSNQHYTPNGSNNKGNKSRSRHSPAPLIMGNHTVSPESSHPASPVTSKFHSFGLLGTSPSGQDSYMSGAASTNTPHVHLSSTPFMPQPQQPSFTASILQQQLNEQIQREQQNPYKTAIYEYLSYTDNDRLVLPAMTLIYLAGRNPGVMSDVLLGTDIYPQRLLKSRLLLGNLTSSTPPPNTRIDCGSVAMSRDLSSDSIISTHSTGTSGAWNISSPTPKNLSSLSGSLFGAAGSATAARMRTRTDSPLFEIDDDDEESRETEELLASNDSEPISPPGPTVANNPPRTSAGSIPSSVTKSASIPRGQSDNGVIVKTTSRSQSRPRASRKTSRTSSILGNSLLPATEESEQVKEGEDENDMGQELRPVFTSERDRQTPEIYPSTDDELESNVNLETKKTLISSPEQDSGAHSPLSPHKSSESRQVGTESEQKPAPGSKQAVPTIQNREEILNRLMNIVCGQPESGAHRFRIITIQMAMELLIEFVFTKGVAAGKEANHQGNSSAVHAAEMQLGEERLERLALAEVQFRDRVQKGIRKLEKKSRRESANPPPLGILTGKVERSLTESKLGIDRQIVNIISEAAMVYGPDRDLDKEPDLNPDPELIALFGLNPEFTEIKSEKPESENDKFLQELEALRLNSRDSTVRERRRSRIRNKFKSKRQESSSTHPLTNDNKPVEQPSRSPPTRLNSGQRLEAMVIRYIKWLHILVQCRQLLCRKPVTPAMALLGLDHQPTVATSFHINSEKTTSKEGSPIISITESLDQIPPRLERRPSDLISVSSSGTVVSAHKGLQKALATTATTNVVGESEHLESLLESIENENSHPFSSASSSPTTVTDASNDSAPPYVSRTSSSSSVTSSSILGTGTVSVTLSQPASGTASGRIIGSRTLLSATAALEAAANTANQTPGSGNGSGLHQPLNEILTHHLDPLSASVSEAIKKSSAKIKNSVVGSFAANTSSLFRYTTAPFTGDHSQPSQDSNQFLSSSAPSRGFYRPPSTIASASSSAASLANPAPTGMQRSLSASSVSSSRSAPTIAPTNSEGVFPASKSTTGSTVGRDSEGHVTLSDSSPFGSKEAVIESEEEYSSILDEGYSGPQMNDQVFKILETLGLVST